VLVAGGGSIYTQAVPIAGEMYLSTINPDYSRACFLNPSPWEIVWG